MKLVAFCEAEADFRLASGLVDRLLRDEGPQWIADAFDTPDVSRRWHPDGLGRPGAAGAAMARKVFLIAQAMSKTTPDDPIHVVILLWDTDHQGDDRRTGVAQASEEARRWQLFQIACGLPDPEREARVLAGFEPEDDTERARLAELRRELGFSPVHEAHRLRGNALRDIKRVLRMLIGDAEDREQRCWTEPALGTFQDRGRESGLAAFLDEFRTALLATWHG